jgi:hypothetical protein
LGKKVKDTIIPVQELKACGDWRYRSIHFNLDNKERLVVSLKPPPPYLVNRIPCADYTRGFVGPRAGLGATKNREDLLLLGN